MFLKNISHAHQGSLLCFYAHYLFDQEYSKNSNIVLNRNKYYYNLK